MNIELNHLQIFERLVLGCMDSYDSESRRIFSIFRDLQDLQSDYPLHRSDLKFSATYDEFCQNSEF